MNTMRLGLLFTLGMLCVGCGATTSSRNIRTAGLVALIDVTSERAGESNVTTSLVVGGANSNTHVVLEGGDHLVASIGKKHQTMQAVSDGDYEAKFDTNGDEVEVKLGRDVDKSASHNKGKLPPPFEITSDYGQKPVSRKHSLTVEWSPSEGGADVNIHISGDCILDQDFDVGGDPGKYVVPAKKIEAWKAQEKQACNATIVVTRTTKGETDRELDSDSRFLLHQVRSTSFVSGP
jgi:hypothetical protein